MAGGREGRVIVQLLYGTRRYGSVVLFECHRKFAIKRCPTSSEARLLIRAAMLTNVAVYRFRATIPTVIQIEISLLVLPGDVVMAQFIMHALLCLKIISRSATHQSACSSSTACIQSVRYIYDTRYIPYHMYLYAFVCIFRLMLVCARYFGVNSPARHTAMATSSIWQIIKAFCCGSREYSSLVRVCDVYGSGPRI